MATRGLRSRRGLSLAAARGRKLRLPCWGFSLLGPPVSWRRALGTWASLVAAWTAVAAGLLVWQMGLVAPQHVESSRPGIKPTYPALAGGFLTTGLPGNSYNVWVKNSLKTYKEQMAILCMCVYI